MPRTPAMIPGIEGDGRSFLPAEAARIHGRMKFQIGKGDKYEHTFV